MKDRWNKWSLTAKEVEEALARIPPPSPLELDLLKNELERREGWRSRIKKLFNLQ